jgi:hypothetical protein
MHTTEVPGYGLLDHKQSRNVLMPTLFNEVFLTVLVTYIASTDKMANGKLENVPQEADADSSKVRSKDLLGVT